MGWSKDQSAVLWYWKSLPAHLNYRKQLMYFGENKWPTGFKHCWSSGLYKLTPLRSFQLSKWMKCEMLWMGHIIKRNKTLSIFMEGIIYVSPHPPTFLMTFIKSLNFLPRVIIFIYISRLLCRLIFRTSQQFSLCLWCWRSWLCIYLQWLGRWVLYSPPCVFTERGCKACSFCFYMG